MPVQMGMSLDEFIRLHGGPAVATGRNRQRMLCRDGASYFHNGYGLSFEPPPYDACECAAARLRYARVRLEQAQRAYQAFERCDRASGSTWQFGQFTWDITELGPPPPLNNAGTLDREPTLARLREIITERRAAVQKEVVFLQERGPQWLD